MIDYLTGLLLFEALAKLKCDKLHVSSFHVQTLAPYNAEHEGLTAIVLCCHIVPKFGIIQHLLLCND